MKLYNKIFCLDKSSINIENVQFVSEEGIIFYIIPEKIEGFLEQLYQTGFQDKKRIIENIYIQIDETFQKYNLCIKYTNKNYKVVPKIGFELSEIEVELLHNILNVQIT